jgi:hypothetical protein
MTKIFWNCLKISPVIAATLFTANSALAGDVSEQMTQVSQLEQQGNAELAQGTSVSRLSDVSPTDWAFQALQSLTERYNCIAGYPDGTFKGKRSLTRYEFAAALNACLNQVNEVIATSTADLVNKQDLATLQRLQEEFRAELATLRGRVDALESRTSFLEAHQFSTTTKLKGEAIFGLSEAFGDQVAVPAAHTPAKSTGVPSANIASNAVFTDRLRLSLNSSFTGTDLLQTRLQAINTLPNSSITGTNQTRLGFDGTDPNSTTASDNALFIDKLNYSYKFGDKAHIKIDATGAELYENVNTFNPDFTASGTGALSRYGRFSPIYRIPGKYTDNAGITLVANVGKPITVSAAYFGGGRDSSLPNSPSSNNGVFNGDNTVLGQLEFKPNDKVDIGLTYAHAYEANTGSANALFGSTGSSFANNPFGATSSTGTSVETNNYGIELSFQPTPKLVLGGWGGYTAASTIDNTGRSAEIWYWATTLAIKDFGKQGNVLGLIFGQPPKVTAYNNGTTTNGYQYEHDTSYQIEGLYKAKISDNILLTPGLIIILNPENNSNNNTEYVGTLRTTFTF